MIRNAAGKETSCRNLKHRFPGSGIANTCPYVMTGNLQAKLLQGRGQINMFLRKVL